MARVAASITCSGVLKSGSPCASSMMSTPAARSSRARCAAAAEAEMRVRATRAARKLRSDSAISVDEDLAFAHQPAPLLPFAAHMLRERFRRAAHCVGALLGELLLHLGGRQNRGRLAVEPLHDILRRRRRDRETAPRQRLVARQPRL